MKLIVRRASKTDVYKDIVRIPEAYRLDHKGKRIDEGAICKVAAATKSDLKIVRGCNSQTSAVILMDEKTRNDLGLDDGAKYYFDLRPVRWIGQCKWAWSATDPAYRIAARLGLLSVVLGTVGLILGCWSLFLFLK